MTAIEPLSPTSPLMLATVVWAEGDSIRVIVVNLDRQTGTVPLQGR